MTLRRFNADGVAAFRASSPLTVAAGADTITRLAPTQSPMPSIRNNVKYRALDTEQVPASPVSQRTLLLLRADPVPERRRF